MGEATPGVGDIEWFLDHVDIWSRRAYSERRYKRHPKLLGNPL